MIHVAVPSQPLPAAYHKLVLQVPQLIQEHAPDLIIHIGLEVESGPGVFKVERSAPRQGYHDIPDVERKVLTRNENKKIFGKSPDSLVTSLDLDTAVGAWEEACQFMWLPKATAFKSKAKGKNEARIPLDLQQTDDVGTYVCGLNYYISMLEMKQRTTKQNVVFLHVPKLDSEEQVQVGIKVVEELIKALVNVWK